MSWTGLVAGLVAGMFLGQSPATLGGGRPPQAEAAFPPPRGPHGLAANEGPDPPRLALLAGTLVLSDGQAAEARELLSAWPAQGPLAPYHSFYLGQSRFYSGDPAGAAKDFARVLELQPPAPAALAARARERL